MTIIKKYFWNVAWYALVLFDDGSKVELKIKQDETAEPTDQDFLTLADEYQQRMMEAAEAQDGNS